SLKITSQNKWNIHYKNNKNFPPNIPKAPDTVYKDKWKGWGTFLGKTHKDNFKRSYSSAKKYVIGKNFTSSESFFSHARNDKTFPDDMPMSPEKVYKNEWEGWTIFLGNDWKSYEEAKKFAQSKNFLSGLKYKEFFRNQNNRNFGLLINIPADPPAIYKDKWEGWTIFLGNDWKSYEEAKEFAQSKNFSSQKEYRKYFKENKDIPKGIPKSPPDVYLKEWKGWQVFLGTERKKIR
ncbi:hypothetical protein N9I94_04425, partial [Candidatus Pelagibacter sp.]|nr:hypothetical protein [Candidatus Pelagibacter sp.]